MGSGRMMPRRPRPIAVSAAVIVGLIVWLGTSAVSGNADLRRENAELRRQLREAQVQDEKQVAALTLRIEQLERVIHDAGLEVPPPFSVIVEDRRSSSPGAGSPPTSTTSTTTTTTTTRPPETTTTTTCRVRTPIVGCVGR